MSHFTSVISLVSVLVSDFSHSTSELSGQFRGKDLSDSELEICFNEADTNKDGKIDVTEFSNLVNKLKKAGKLRDMPR